MKIVVSGSAGIGKTRLAKKLSDYLGIPYIPDCIDDNLNANGFSSWKDVKSKKKEREIRLTSLKQKIEKENKTESFVSDKGSIDYLAYWLILTSNYATEAENEEFLRLAKEHAQTYDKVIIPVFGVYEAENPDKRNVSYSHRFRIHCLIEGIYSELGIGFDVYNFEFGTPAEKIVEDLNIIKEKKKRVGLFLGTFDPIHLGHIVIAKDAKKSLDEVWMQPHTDNPKAERKHLTLEHRVKMIELAIKNLDGIYLRVDPFNTYKAGNYRENLIQEVMKEFPLFYFCVIMGSDKLKHPAYKNSSLLQIPHIIYTRQLLSEKDKKILSNFNKARVVESPSDVSSREIKRLIKKCSNVNNLTGDNVFRYIQEKKLYL